MLIDCDTCQARGSGCANCVMSVILGGPPDGVELDAAEQAALDVLAQAGMAPRLLHPVTEEHGACRHSA